MGQKVWGHVLERSALEQDYPRGTHQTKPFSHQLQYAI